VVAHGPMHTALLSAQVIVVKKVYFHPAENGYPEGWNGHGNVNLLAPSIATWVVYWYFPGTYTSEVNQMWEHWSIDHGNNVALWA
jgi:hypothetical protein